MKKTFTIQILTFAIIIASPDAQAHCPVLFKAEKLCLMLDNNLLYFYSHLSEHNGPYKDIDKKTEITILDDKKTKLTFTKKARGIFEINSKMILKKITVKLILPTKTEEIFVKHE